ncbi:transcription termination/antitermination NusG family protein [Zooshikella sp. RANM57]|uniref:transcription termination/antitermination NusG family protein n=1 Tax=Zooshikella sp. RANM57 TaxID=3425863 RepID=UPI003D6EBED7
MWYLLKTKPREEVRAVTHLENQDFTVYCPWIDKLDKAGKIKKEPLFPGYVFLNNENIEGLNYSKVRSTRGVANFVRFGTNHAEASNELIEYIKCQEVLFRTKSGKFKENQLIEFTEGPFKYLQGIYLSKSGDERCIILLNILSRKQIVSVNQKLIKAVL